MTRNDGWMNGRRSRIGMCVAVAALVAAPVPSLEAQEAPGGIPPGEYASRQVVSSRARLRPANRWVRVATTSVVLHRVERDSASDAGGLTATSRYCSVDQAPLGRTRTSLGPAFIEAIPTWSSRLLVNGSTAELEEHVVVLGASLDDPGADPLPRDADDPRVVDVDGDGQPGFSVEVEGIIDGQVYMVQRLVRGLVGELTGGGRMRGTVTIGGGQEVIGASNQILKTFTPRFEPDTDESRSTFVWVPVPEGSTCESVLAAAPELFGEEPER